ncbi:OPT/YSL family transporter [bacterium]|nr:OPT/YSL family transporter [bacterium]
MSTTLGNEEASAASKELTPQERELDWYKNVYQGDSMPQLTVRSVLMGSVLGAIMSLSNLYVGLKTGWGLGVAITACILSYAIWTTLRKVGLAKTDMSILENNAMQSTASAAGYSTGGTMVSAIAAYLIVTKTNMEFWTLMGWTFFLAMLGVMLAIPMKRQMINHEQLRFPSGVAAAATLKSLHAKGGDAVRQARTLFQMMGLGAVVAWARDGMPWLAGKLKMNLPALPADFHFPLLKIAGQPIAKWTFTLEASTIMIAAGALMGWKTGWSMLLGAVATYAIAVPQIWQHFPDALLAHGADPKVLLDPTFFPTSKAIRNWSLWGGSAMMVSSGMLGFALQWKTIVRALTPQKASTASGEADPLAAIEVPNSWFWAGTTIAALGVMTIMHFAFHVKPWMSLIAVIMTFFLSLVACRATGETDTTPIGAMGKITQLTYGVLAPANVVTNLMTACVTAGAAGSAADLLTDLKSGYLLGANPRKQFLAQFAGIFVGTAVVVPVWYLLVPNADVLGSEKFPAPAAQVWASVAQLLSNGIGSLHPTIQVSMLVGGLIGIILPLIELALPKKAKAFVPSPTALGLSMVIPATNAISMFLGALLALIWEKRNSKQAEAFLIPIAAGLIAGESLLGVGIVLLSVLAP